MKIPCSVSILTLNSEAGLPACLESLKDFAEIIVCDGNSTDRTRAIAQNFGAVVISQYDTNEPNTPCVSDKAAVRERAMGASTHAWRFFMDADDTLSPELVQEIRAIVSQKQPKHFIWRMPTRIFIGNKEILHEATYPSYQTRLVHSSVGARFKNPIHDHLVWDTARFRVGTLEHTYDFQWSEARVKNYWAYLRGYAVREIEVERPNSLLGVIQWSFRRARTIFGYVFWRLPVMYARWGIKDSMPISIELTIIRYHCLILYGVVAKYVRTRFWWVVMTETMRGKDLNRILSNLAVREYEAYGCVLDVGGGHDASYWRYLSTRRWFRKTTIDINPKVRPDFVVNLEMENIPFPNAHFDTVLFFNILEHLRARPKVLADIRRVLKKNGSIIGIVPFLVAVHGDPHDFVRPTRDELLSLFREVGFLHVTIHPVGRGPLTASYYQSEFLWPRLLKLIVIPIVLALDAMVLALRPHWHDKFPLSYAFEAR